MEKPKVLTGDTLTFETSGAWCVGNDCSAAVGGANPIGVKMVTHEVRVGNGWEPAHYVGSLANGSLISRMVSYNLQLCSFPWQCDPVQVLNVTDFDGHFEAKGVPSILALTLGPPSLVIAHFGSFCAGRGAVPATHRFLFTFLALCWYSFGEKSKPNSLVYRCDHQETVEMVRAQ